MKKKNKVLSLEILPYIGGLQGMSSGNALIHRFCDAVKAGQQPNNSDLQAVANALEIYRRGPVTPRKNAVFSERLKLMRTQGKSISAKSNWWNEVGSVADYYGQRDDYIKKGETQQDAEVAARALIRAREGIGDRAMKNRIKKHMEAATLMCQIAIFKPE